MRTPHPHRYGVRIRVTMIPKTGVAVVVVLDSLRTATFSTLDKAENTFRISKKCKDLKLAKVLNI